MEEFLNKHIKCVFRDNNQEKVIRGVLQSFDEYTLTILGDRDNNLVVIGKGVLVSLREDSKWE